jgi:hypothetical protein
LKSNSPSSASESERSHASISVETSLHDADAAAFASNREQPDCTNVPNDGIARALLDAERAWGLAQDRAQLRRAVLRILQLLEVEP